jgi:glycosyltransferase involved in cell wall biosynthesis
MRIAFFSEVYWPMVSGVANTLLRLVEALEERGHAVRVYSATYPLDGMPDRPEVHRSPSRPLLVSPEVQWAFADHGAIRADLARFAPDLVHVVTEFAMGVAGLRAARALGVPLIASAHTDYERYAGRYGLAWTVGPGWHYLRWFYRNASRVLAPSGVYERHLRARGVAHTGIWTRGVDSSRFHPGYRSNDYRRSCDCGPDDVLVTYVGRLAPEKGLDVLLDAWYRLGDRRRGARLAFVGRGLMEPEIRRRALPGVFIKEFRRGAALAEAYASADVFAFPSGTETFGNVLLEAMASHLAPVAVADGGLVDYAEHGRNALLVPPGDAQAFAEALGRLIGDPQLRRRLAQAGRHTAEARSWSAVDDRLLEEYRSVIAERKSSIAA